MPHSTREPTRVRRFGGKLPVNWLLEEYTCSGRLADCLRLLFERGAVLPDPALAPVLLDDAAALKTAVKARPSLLEHRTTLVSAFTSLVGVSLLHVAAEYGNLNAARALVEAGADVNATAAVDEFGLNGHTPLFHTVNSIRNRSEPIMRLLLAARCQDRRAARGHHVGEGLRVGDDILRRHTHLIRPNGASSTSTPERA